jgi:hypothetical protein
VFACGSACALVGTVDVMRRLVIALVLLATNVRAEMPGMYCVGAHDEGPRGTAARTITMDGDSLDCLIVLPAKLICRAAVASRPGVAPGPVSDDEWLCYAVRCPREETQRRVIDEFGAHDVRGGRGKLYCTPDTLTE